MNGHNALMAMRRGNGAPRAVWVTDGPDKRARSWQEEANIADGRMHAALQIDAGDIPEGLDLRCCIGLEVHVAAERGADRGRRLHAVFVDAGAKRVITSIYGGDGVELLLHGVSHG